MLALVPGGPAGERPYDGFPVCRSCEHITIGCHPLERGGGPATL